MSDKLVKIDRIGRVVLVTLNRPDKRNALGSPLLQQLLDELTPLDADPDVGCFVITGTGASFAAGADIAEMAARDYVQMAQEDYFANWLRFTDLRTPKIAAVNGHAFGGGCELAMMCDFIIAGESALFGQPEITLGVIPGMGGSQRLTRLVGKGKAMEMILTGKTVVAKEAERMGLVARVCPDEALLNQALATAEKVASFSKPAIMAAKEVVDRAEELSLTEGLRFERRVFHGLFATQDQKEGMQAFLQKREAKFIGR